MKPGQSHTHSFCYYFLNNTATAQTSSRLWLKLVPLLPFYHCSNLKPSMAQAGAIAAPFTTAQNLKPSMAQVAAVAAPFTHCSNHRRCRQSRQLDCMIIGEVSSDVQSILWQLQPCSEDSLIA
jgi:hypothetical protein